MKKPALLLIIFVLCSSMAFAAELTRELPERIDPLANVIVKLNIKNAIPGKIFTLEEKLPDDFSISAWSIDGAVESKTKIKTRFIGTKYAWSFTANNKNPVVSYTLQVPEKIGDHTFDAVYFDSTGQSRIIDTITVRVVTCGDGFCEGDETSDSCMTDCPREVVTPVDQPETNTEPIPKKGNNTAPILVVFILIAAAVVVYFGYFRKSKPQKPEKEKVPIYDIHEKDGKAPEDKLPKL